MTAGVPEWWALEHLAGQEPAATLWFEACWSCPAPGNPASDRQLAWKRLQPDAFVRAIRWSEAELGVRPPQDCESDRCQVLVAALESEP